MKTWVMVVAGLLLGGCAAHPTTSAGTMGSGAAPAPADPHVSEMSRDGKTYVFNSDDDMSAFSNGKPQAIEREAPGVMSASNQPVIVEAADDADYASILSRYKAAHGMK